MIGTVFSTYNDYLKTVSEYAENEVLNSEKYQPSSVADKNFFLLFEEKTYKPSSGNTEEATVKFTLKVIYKFPSKNSLSVNQTNTWNSMGELERGLMDFADSEGDVICFDSIGLSKLTPDFWLATFAGRLIYLRSTEYE
jgi:hypothetical protein